MEIRWRDAINLTATEAEQIRDLGAQSKSAPFADLEVLQAWSASTAHTCDVLAGFAVADERLCGLLVVSRPSNQPGDEWQLWGEQVDFGVIWTDPAQAHECWLQWFGGLQEQGVTSVLLRNLRVADPSVSAMLNAASRTNIGLDLLDRRKAPYVDLSTGHDGWLAARSASQRRQYRRAHRRFLSIPDLDLRLVESADDLGEALGDFFVLHRERRGALEKTSVYDDARTVHFLETLIHLWSPAGRVRALVARSGSRVIGVELLLVTEHTWYSFNGGWSLDFARYHVGTGLLIEAMHAARADGAYRYSLLEGEEPYKLRMADGGHQLASWRLVLPVD